jgi:hypothetical protein
MSAEIAISRSIIDNGSSPYGGCTSRFIINSREWHSGQDNMWYFYTEHGSNNAANGAYGYYIYQAGPRDLASGGYWFYMRLLSGVRYRMSVSADMNFNANQMGGPEYDVADPGGIQRITLGSGVIGSNGNYNRLSSQYGFYESDVRTPIFYDSQNTGYYCDPSGTSVLHTLINNVGWLEVRSNVYATNPTTTAGLFFGWNKSGGTGEANIIVDGGADTGQFLFQRYNGGGSYTNIFQADIYGLTANSGTVNVFSDIRLKTNITNATPKLSDLMKLNVVNYEFVGEYDVLGKQLGFIAQEVEQIFPSLVREQDTRQYDEQGNYIKGYEDTKILKVGMEFAMLVKAMQEQQSIIDSLKSEIETLKQK